MREDELIASVKRKALLSDTNPDYPDAVIRAELNECLKTTFTSLMFQAHSGMLLKRFAQATVANVAAYPLPARAISGAIETVDMADGSSYWPLTLLSDTAQIAYYESLSARGKPLYFAIVGSSIRLYPTPDAAYVLRQHYYLRPSKLVPFQTTGLINSVTATSATSTTVVLASFPFDRGVNGVVLASASAYLDIVRGGSSSAAVGRTGASTYECVMADVMPASFSLGGLSLTFTTATDSAAGADLSEIRAGDWVRFGDQSDWPTLPDEWHSTLARATAAKIMADLGRPGAKLQADIVSGEISALRDAIQPRVKANAPALVPGAHMLRRGNVGRWYG